MSLHAQSSSSLKGLLAIISSIINAGRERYVIKAVTNQVPSTIGISYFDLCGSILYLSTDATFTKNIERCSKRHPCPYTLCDLLMSSDYCLDALRGRLCREAQSVGDSAHPWLLASELR